MRASRAGGGRAPLITAFYSFKGGVGRSLAAYNTALRVAKRQQRVLLVDADLEAPGLTLALIPSDRRERQGGFAELLADVINRLDDAWTGGDPLDPRLPDALASEVENHAHPVWQMDAPAALAQSLAAAFPAHAEALTAQGAVFLLGVGQVHLDFTATLRRLDSAALFDKPLQDEHDGRILEPLGWTRDACPTLGHVAVRLLRAALAGPSWDQVFVDSRTGLAEIGGICFRHLADRRVVVSGLNRQNLEGTRLVLDRLLPRMRAPSELTVVLSPVPNGELDLLRERHEAAGALFGTTPLALPYVPRLALVEEAFVGDTYELSPLAQAYDRLAERVLGMLGMLGTDAGTLVARVFDALSRHTTTADQDTDWPEVIKRLLELALAHRSAASLLVGAIATPLIGSDEAPSLSEERKRYLRDLLLLWPLVEDETDAGRLTTLATSLAMGGVLLGGATGRGFLEQSLNRYARALELKPDLHEALYNWGSALSELGKLLGPPEGRPFFEQAFDKYARALELKPDMHEALNNWGVALYELGKLLGLPEGRPYFEQAGDKYARALEIKPDDHAALNNWGSALSGLDKLLEPPEGRPFFEQAFDKYARALEIKPDHEPALHNWGLALRELGRLLGPAPHPAFFDDALARYARVSGTPLPDAGHASTQDTNGTSDARAARARRKPPGTARRAAAITPAGGSARATRRRASKS